MEEIYKVIDAFDFSGYKEAVFCGYGEPTMALDKLLQSASTCEENIRHILTGTGIPVQESSFAWIQTALVTWSISSSIAKEVCSAVDVVSISLNMPDAKSYNEVVRPAYGEKAFDAMLKFAADCKKYTENVKFTVVDCIGEENIEKSRKVAEKLGIPLRVREYTAE